MWKWEEPSCGGSVWCFFGTRLGACPKLAPTFKHETVRAGTCEGLDNPLPFVIDKRTERGYEIADICEQHGETLLEIGTRECIEVVRP